MGQVGRGGPDRRLARADLDGLAPEVEGLARSPGLEGALQAEVERWTLRARMVEAGPTLTLTATLCTAGGACTEHASEATRAEPTPAVAEILAEIAEEMGRGEEPGAAAARAEVLPNKEDNG